MADPWVDMVTVIPSRSQGVARIEHCVVTPEEESRSHTRAVVTGRADFLVRKGSYAQLFVNQELMMSDTPMERRTNSGLLWRAKGHVFIAGLGVGMVVPPLVANPEVTRVTIVEKYDDVIALVEAPLRAFLGEQAAKLEVIHSDIFDFKAPKDQKYDTIYFDIWPDIDISNLEEMTLLHRRFARRKAPEGWMHSWQKDTLQYRKRSGRW
jgi:predicted membrane-bound spermidine synthase